MPQFAVASHVASCPLQLAVAVTRGRWRTLIIHHLGEGVDRFGQLKRRIDGISERMLAQELNALQDLGLVAKTIYPEMPPRTDYRLTEDGRELHAALQPLRQWGKRYKTVVPLGAEVAT
jgi:DNA-binding HxlR family transcriptional regulator